MFKDLKNVEIIDMLNYKGLGRVQDLPKKTKGLASDTQTLMVVLMECICEVVIVTTKKQKTLVEMFETLTNQWIAKYGQDLKGDPEIEYEEYS